MTLASTASGTQNPQTSNSQTPSASATPTPLLRTGAVWLSGSALLALLVTLCISAVAVATQDWADGLAPSLVAGVAELSPLRSPATPTAAAVLLLAGLAGTVASLRLWWILTTTCACAARGRTLRHDSRTRRMVLAACGVALTVGAVAPAHASDLSSLDGLPLPERPVSTQTTTQTTTEPTVQRATAPTPDATLEPTATPTAAPTGAAPESAPARTAAPSPKPAAATPSSRATSQPAAPVSTPASTPANTPGTAKTATHSDTGSKVVSHVVSPGDTLWGIAQDTRNAHTTAADTSATVRALHRTNADVIGADPDLLLPGQVLTLPAPHTDAPSDSAPPTAPQTAPQTTPDPTSTEETR